MRLENWSVTRTVLNPYQAPETGTPALAGRVYGHEAIEDGSFIITTRPVTVSDGKVRTASGSLYELGEVDPGYEAAYPNAKERLFASLSKGS